MKKALAIPLVLALAACSDKAKLGAVAESSPPKTVTVSALPAAEPAQPDADKELAQRVVRAIDAAKLHGIDVVAVSGVVTLWGAAPSAKERDRAGRVPAKVEGVKSVDNKLEVVTGS